VQFDKIVFTTYAVTIGAVLSGYVALKIIEDKRKARGR